MAGRWSLEEFTFLELTKKVKKNYQQMLNNLPLKVN
jgi:hypothetical protein